jgi:hypothetical protein
MDLSVEEWIGLFVHADGEQTGKPMLQVCRRFQLALATATDGRP